MISARQRKDWREHPRLVDGLLATVVLLLAPIVAEPDGAGGPDLVRLTAVRVLLAAATCALLVWRRDHSRAVLAGTLAGTCAASLLTGQPLLLSLAALIALYTLATRRDRRATMLAWLATAAALMATEVAVRGVLDPEVLSTLAWTAVAAAVGDALGHRRAYLAAVEERAERAERDREEQSRRRVAEERLRIARELHDVVAHHIAVVNVQAGVAGYLLPSQPEAAQEALGHVRRAAGAILDELSGILNVLRDGEQPAGPTAPAPGLAQLDELVTDFAASGLVVDWSLSGRPRELGAVVDLVAYRLVQEALTNAQKHGTGTASLRLSYLPQQLRLQVSNPLPSREPVLAGGRDARGGHGLIGMRERASAVGGEVRLGAEADGLFRLEAVLPLPSAS